MYTTSPTLRVIVGSEFMQDTMAAVWDIIVAPGIIIQHLTMEGLRLLTIAKGKRTKTK